MHSASKFKPAWWLTNGHAQTLVAKLFRHKQKLVTCTETLELPDGDFIDLAWTEQPEKNNTRPIVLMLHGLAGSKDSHYARGMLNAIKNRGWIAVLMHFRGCSGNQVMAKIKQPCLFIHAADDPFLNHQCSLPPQKLPEHLIFEVSNHGGHVGFIHGNNPLKPQYWLEQRVPDFLTEYLANENEK